MANIYPYTTGSWTYTGVSRVSSNAFRFTAGSYATTEISGLNVGELSGELQFRGFLSPGQANLTQGLRCRLDIYSKQDETQPNWSIEKHFVYLKGDRNGALNQTIATGSGEFDHILLSLEALPDAALSAGGTISLTSFIINNASGTSMERITNEINAALPLLVYDKNDMEQTNGNSDAEIFVGMVPLSVHSDKEDVDAGFRTNIAVDAAGILTQRYYRDGIEELLSPVIKNVSAGRHLITDDHAYINVAKGGHTYTASMQFVGGNMEIDTRKTLYTVSSPRAGERDIRIDGNVLDLTFSGVPTKFMPDEVWVMVKSLITDAINIQHGAYEPDTQTVAFQNDIEYLTDIVNGAIEFNGVWQKSATNKGKKTFVSAGKPKVLLQRQDGSLTYGDYDKPDAPVFVIEPSGVVDCSLILGWNFADALTLSNDMGMIAAYLKTDGKAYYRTIINGAMDTVAYPLDFIGASYPLKELRTFRTNDYRVGFTATDSADTLYTILTARYWQGDSVESLYLTSELGAKNQTYWIADREQVDAKPIQATNPVDGQHVNIFWNEELERTYDANGDPVQITGVTFTDSSPVPITVVADSITVSETNRALLEFVSTSQRGFDTWVYVTHYGLMTEKFANRGIDGLTAPIYVKVTSSNGKTVTKTIGTNAVLNLPVPNSTTTVTGLVSRGTPDNPLPPVSDQNKLADNWLKGQMGRQNVAMTPILWEHREQRRYETERLQGSFGQDKITYAPTMTELLLTTAHEDTSHKLTSTFSADHVSYVYQAYALNNTPV